MKIVLKINYIVDNLDMNDQDFENQEEKTLLVTEKMLEQLVEDNVELKPGDSIDWQYCRVSTST